ncbi:MAG: carbon-nitrogen family hydrolase [Elusimicrobia bacterium]|nr:carbon-nitrogen family hydrolase [Elusimicrobiota bacterium]
MKIGLFQYKIKWSDKKANKARIIKLLELADVRGIDWVIFPEMTLSGFGNNIKNSTLTDDDSLFFANLSKKYHINISYGGVEDRYNKIITLNRNGEMISDYSKINLFSPAKEDKYYKKGKRTTTFDMEGFMVSPFICFDLRFPDLFWKTARFSNLYILIAAWPYQRINHWTSLLCARAIENQAYIIGVNSIGEDDEGNEYKGYSTCFSPNGDMLIDCQSREGLSVVDINPDDVLNIRKNFRIRKDLIRD